MASVGFSPSSSWIKSNFSSSMPKLCSVNRNYSSKNTISCSFHTPPIFQFSKHFQTALRSLIKTRLVSVSASSSSSPSSSNKWSFLQRTAAAALNAIENALISSERHSLPKTVDPSIQITGNFAPVPEQPVTEALSVTGKVPDCIRGVYVRNGPNPLHEPVAGHHLFDGDGMVHIVEFSDSGQVSYACRLTETQRLVQERAYGRPVFPKAIGELHGHFGIARLILFYVRGLFGLVDHSHGIGVANASLVFFNGRLLAMSEEDLPYQIQVTPVGDLETIGRFDFDGQLKSSMIAHPKIDPVSGEMFALSYDLIRNPHLKYFKFSREGEKSLEVEIPLPQPTMVHDFAITEKFVVIPDQQVIFKLLEMMRGGSPMIYDKEKTPRFGILDKNATNSISIKWIEVPECFCFHLWNAWEESKSNEIVVIGSCITPEDSIFNECEENLKSVLSQIRLNLSTGKSTRRPIIGETEQVNLEAGMVNRNRLGRKTQFVFLALAEPWPKVSGFAKVDLFTGEIKKYMYNEQRYGGEPLFLPRDGATVEDDGHVLAFVHDEKEWKSELQIVNAITLELEATVKLPSRVPYGFHGTFISSKDLKKQIR